MSTQREHPTITSPKARRKGLAAATATAAGIWLAFAATTAPATAVDQPEPTTPVQSSATAPQPGPPNYPAYAPRYEAPRVETVTDHENGLDTTSIALGTLGGIALAGAGLGITLGIQRRRDRPTPHTA